MLLNLCREGPVHSRSGLGKSDLRYSRKRRVSLRPPAPTTSGCFWWIAIKGAPQRPFISLSGTHLNTGNMVFFLRPKQTEKEGAILRQAGYAVTRSPGNGLPQPAPASHRRELDGRRKGQQEQSIRPGPQGFI